MAADPVIAAGIGVRLGRGFAVRAASFRLTGHLSGQAVLGVLIRHPAQATAIIDLLAGVARPAYGELRVLGHDMATIRGRAAVRRRVGVARRSARALPWLRVRGLVTHGARMARHGWGDRHVLAAAILDRMSLTPWSDVPLQAVPEAVARRARLAAAAVHQPELLLLDGWCTAAAASLAFLATASGTAWSGTSDQGVSDSRSRIAAASTWRSPQP